MTGSPEIQHIIVILNGVSRKKGLFYKQFLPALSASHTVEVLETREANHAIALAAVAAERKPDCILAAGGDGTLNQTLNGLLASAEPGHTLPALGIIPLGTGNDFARLCKLGNDPASIIERLHQPPQPTDVGMLSCRDENGTAVIRYFINACSVGMGPAVVRRLESSDRSFGPNITYLKAILQTLFSHAPQEISIRSKDWEWSGPMRVLAIANGQSFGNAIYIAPDARPDDGLFSTLIVGDVRLVKFLYYLQKIKSARKIKDPKVWYNTVERLELSSSLPAQIEAEGEIAGFLPATVEVLPGKIKFVR